MLKYCTKCGLEKDLEDFGFDNRRKYGRQSRCRPCCNQANRERNSTPEGKAIKKKLDAAYRQSNLEKVNSHKRAKHKERTDFINQFKNKPCSDCMKIYHADCMELDHVRGEKSGNVSEMRMTSIDKLIQEMEKCEVVCAVCHRIRTDNRRPPSKEKRLLEHRAQINQFKSKPCTDCGNTFSPVAMDLDHVRGEKVFEISNMGHYPRWKVLEELDKCEVVCANCHRIRTKSRKII